MPAIHHALNLDSNFALIKNFQTLIALPQMQKTTNTLSCYDSAQDSFNTGKEKALKKYIYIYIYIYRERERERERDIKS